MAGKKYSDATVTDGVTANATDRWPVLRAGANVYIKPSYLLTYIAANLTSSTGLVAKYHISSNLTLNNGVYTIFNADTSDYDPGADVTIGAGWVYTCPATAWYDVRLSFAFCIANGNAWTNAGYAEADVFINGSTAYSIRQERTNANDGTSRYLDLGGSVAMSCTAGDTIQVKIWNGTGATRKMETDSAIEIYRVT